MTASTRIDHLINAVKWPSALISAVFLPSVVYATYGLVQDVIANPMPIVSFVIGAGIFLFLWRSWLATTSLGNWLIQFEHELTHMIFAMLTFHSIVGFRASVSKGSHIKFIGQGNWLITSAPYFFPTAAVLFWMMSWFLPIQWLPWSSLALGFAMGYHLISTYRETHVEQGDLQQIGFVFSWLFLPTINLLMIGLIVAFSHNGLTGMSAFVGRMFEPLTWAISLLNRFAA